MKGILSTALRSGSCSCRRSLLSGKNKNQSVFFPQGSMEVALCRLATLLLDDRMFLGMRQDTGLP